MYMSEAREQHSDLESRRHPAQFPSFLEARLREVTGVDLW